MKRSKKTTHLHDRKGRHKKRKKTDKKRSQKDQLLLSNYRNEYIPSGTSFSEKTFVFVFLNFFLFVRAFSGLVLAPHHPELFFLFPLPDKVHCNICDQILEGLEQVDDECDVFGIHMVKIQDPQLAKRYSIKTFPALVYFRNGNPLIFEGDLQNEQSVLEWLIDDDNRELADEIEEVNERMLERLMQESALICVFFCEIN
jgi:hypothetical protein